MKYLEFFRKPWIWFVTLGLYLSLIFFMSHLSADELRALPIRFWDKLVHFFEYLPVGLMVTGLIHALWPRMSFQKGVPLAICIVAILGGLDEFHQSFIPGREVSVGDATADTLGATIGAFCALLFLRVIRRKQNTATIS